MGLFKDAGIKECEHFCAVIGVSEHMPARSSQCSLQTRSTDVRVVLISCSLWTSSNASKSCKSSQLTVSKPMLFLSKPRHGFYAIFSQFHAEHPPVSQGGTQTRWIYQKLKDMVTPESQHFMSLFLISPVPWSDTRGRKQLPRNIVQFCIFSQCGKLLE